MGQYTLIFNKVPYQVVFIQFRNATKVQVYSYTPLLQQCLEIVLNDIPNIDKDDSDKIVSLLAFRKSGSLVRKSKLLGKGLGIAVLKDILQRCYADYTHIYAAVTNLNEFKSRPLSSLIKYYKTLGFTESDRIFGEIIFEARLPLKDRQKHHFIFRY
jgi:GNAT superfamily N-acetyltransferase